MAQPAQAAQPGAVTGLSAEEVRSLALRAFPTGSAIAALRISLIEQLNAVKTGPAGALSMSASDTRMRLSNVQPAYANCPSYQGSKVKSVLVGADTVFKAKYVPGETSKAVVLDIDGLREAAADPSKCSEWEQSPAADAPPPAPPPQAVSVPAPGPQAGGKGRQTSAPPAVTAQFVGEMPSTQELNIVMMAMALYRPNGGPNDAVMTLRCKLACLLARITDSALGPHTAPGTHVGDALQKSAPDAWQSLPSAGSRLQRLADGCIIVDQQGGALAVRLDLAELEKQARMAAAVELRSLGPLPGGKKGGATQSDAGNLSMAGGPALPPNLGLDGNGNLPPAKDDDVGLALTAATIAIWCPGKFHIAAGVLAMLGQPGQVALRNGGRTVSHVGFFLKEVQRVGASNRVLQSELNTRFIGNNEPLLSFTSQGPSSLVSLNLPAIAQVVLQAAAASQTGQAQPHQPGRTASWPPNIQEFPVQQLHQQAQPLSRYLVSVLSGIEGPEARNNLLTRCIRQLAALAGPAASPQPAAPQMQASLAGQPIPQMSMSQAGMPGLVMPGASQQALQLSMANLNLGPNAPALLQAARAVALQQQQQQQSLQQRTSAGAGPAQQLVTLPTGQVVAVNPMQAMVLQQAMPGALIQSQQDGGMPGVQQSPHMAAPGGANPLMMAAHQAHLQAAAAAAAAAAQQPNVLANNQLLQRHVYISKLIMSAFPPSDEPTAILRRHAAMHLAVSQQGPLGPHSMMLSEVARFLHTEKPNEWQALFGNASENILRETLTLLHGAPGMVFKAANTYDVAVQLDLAQLERSCMQAGGLQQPGQAPAGPDHSGSGGGGIPPGQMQQPGSNAPSGAATPMSAAAADARALSMNMSMQQQVAAAAAQHAQHGLNTSAPAFIPGEPQMLRASFSSNTGMATSPPQGSLLTAPSTAGSVSSDQQRPRTAGGGGGGGSQSHRPSTGYMSGKVEGREPCLAGPPPVTGGDVCTTSTGASNINLTQSSSCAAVIISNNIDARNISKHHDVKVSPSAHPQASSSPSSSDGAQQKAATAAPVVTQPVTSGKQAQTGGNNKGRAQNQKNSLKRTHSTSKFSNSLSGRQTPQPATAPVTTSTASVGEVQPVNITAQTSTNAAHVAEAKATTVICDDATAVTPGQLIGWASAAFATSKPLDIARRAAVKLIAEVTPAGNAVFAMDGLALGLAMAKAVPDAYKSLPASQQGKLRLKALCDNCPVFKRVHLQPTQVSVSIDVQALQAAATPSKGATATPAVTAQQEDTSTLASGNAPVTAVQVAAASDAEMTIKVVTTAATTSATCTVTTSSSQAPVTVSDDATSATKSAVANSAAAITASAPGAKPVIFTTAAARASYQDLLYRMAECVYDKKDPRRDAKLHAVFLLAGCVNGAGSASRSLPLGDHSMMGPEFGNAMNRHSPSAWAKVPAPKLTRLCTGDRFLSVSKLGDNRAIKLDTQALKAAAEGVGFLSTCSSSAQANAGNANVGRSVPASKSAPGQKRSAPVAANPRAEASSAQLTASAEAANTPHTRSSARVADKPETSDRGATQVKSSGSSTPVSLPMNASKNGQSPTASTGSDSVVFISGSNEPATILTPHHKAPSVASSESSSCNVSTTGSTDSNISSSSASDQDQAGVGSKGVSGTSAGVVKKQSPVKRTTMSSPLPTGGAVLRLNPDACQYIPTSPNFASTKAGPTVTKSQSAGGAAAAGNADQQGASKNAPVKQPSRSFGGVAPSVAGGDGFSAPATTPVLTLDMNNPFYPSPELLKSLSNHELGCRLAAHIKNMSMMTTNTATQPKAVSMPGDEALEGALKHQENALLDLIAE